MSALPHRSGPRAEERPLTGPERDLLRRLLARDPPGGPELRAQAAAASVARTCFCGCPSIDLLVAPGTPPAPVAGTRVPARLLVASGTGGEPLGELLLFVEDGLVTRLEYDFWSDAPPASWPPLDRLVDGSR